MILTIGWRGGGDTYYWVEGVCGDTYYWVEGVCGDPTHLVLDLDQHLDHVTMFSQSGGEEGLTVRHLYTAVATEQIFRQKVKTFRTIYGLLIYLNILKVKRCE